MQIDRFRHIVITGASSGLGAALARRYAREGRMLTLGGRNEQRLGAVAKECRALGADVYPMIVDIRDRRMTRAALADAGKRATIDHLIASAGLGGGDAVAAVSGEPPEFADDMVSVNVGGLIASVLAVLPEMTSQRRGQITLVGSLAGGLGLPQSPVYSATKAAVQTYGDGLRRRLRGSGVSVTTVLAGFVDTPMSRSIPMEPIGLWTAEKAAEAIAVAVDRGRSVVTFPWHLSLALRTAQNLPRPLVDFLLAQSMALTRQK